MWGCCRFRGGMGVSPGPRVPCCGQLVSAVRVCQVRLRCRCRADGDLLAGQSSDSPPGQSRTGCWTPLT